MCLPRGEGVVAMLRAGVNQCLIYNLQSSTNTSTFVLFIILLLIPSID